MKEINDMNVSEIETYLSEIRNQKLIAVRDQKYKNANKYWELEKNVFRHFGILSIGFPYCDSNKLAILLKNKKRSEIIDFHTKEDE